MADIFEPGDHFVWYGDGAGSQFLLFDRMTDREGVEHWKFVLRPGRRVIAKYNLKDDEDIDPSKGIVLRSYPKSDCTILDNDPKHIRILVKTDFNGHPTDLSRETMDKDTEIQTLHRRLNSMKALIAQQDEDFEFITNNSEAYFDKVSRLFDKMKDISSAPSKNNDPEEVGE